MCGGVVGGSGELGKLGGFGEDAGSGWLEQAKAATVMSISANAEDRMVRLQAMLHQVNGGPRRADEPKKKPRIGR